jgi:1,4-dihydroxy-2-naphthoate octaprenyltransferase
MEDAIEKRVFLSFLISPSLPPSLPPPLRAYHDLLLLFAAGALLSFFYTSPPFHLKCRALGDVVIYLCFGPLLTQFTALLLLAPSSLPPSFLHVCHLPVGLLTEGILHANNTRDITMDKKSGTVTLAGKKGGREGRRARSTHP